MSSMFPSPLRRWVGQYAIMNTAGLIDVTNNRYQTHGQAKRASTRESMAGYNGECWPVRLIKGKDTK